MMHAKETAASQQTASRQSVQVDNKLKKKNEACLNVQISLLIIVTVLTPAGYRRSTVFTSFVFYVIWRLNATMLGTVIKKK